MLAVIYHYTKIPKDNPVIAHALSLPQAALYIILAGAIR